MKTKRNKFKTLLISAFVVIFFWACSEKTETKTELAVTPTSIDFPAEGGEVKLDITCNGTWQITNASDWCNESLSGADGDQKISIIAKENTSEEAREVLIVITADAVTRQVRIKQSGLVQELDPNIDPGFDYDETPDKTNMREITSTELVSEMTVGWNLGNSLEAIGGETAWGNPVVTKQLIDSVKAAGFNLVRIPVAWSKFSDESNFVIEESWMERVEEVVNYVLDNDMYAMLNIHWDGGWMQPTATQQIYVNNRLEIMWEQIANHFMDYDDHLLFAGTNEVMVEGDYSTPSKEYYTVQNSFNQTFVNTVRRTGGRNAYRHLIVQGFNTNINYAVSYAEIPEDVVDNHLIMEVHYYDPFLFTIDEGSETQWGSDVEDPSKASTWATESYADNQFKKMKTNFGDKGIPVIMGEYGAIKKPAPDNAKYRLYYLEYVTKSMKEQSIIPVYWDNGYAGTDNAFGLFDRNTGTQVEREIISAITNAAK